MPIDANELTLDELAIALAPAVADSAVFDGWSNAAVDAAAQMEGVDPDVARLAFPGGAMDMIAAWIASIDRDMAEAIQHAGDNGDEKFGFAVLGRTHAPCSAR